MNTSHSADFSKELSVDTSYPELTVKEFDEASFTDQHQIQAKRASSTVPQSSGRPKEEIHPSIPWQRRDMSRKEEYEFLELNPFSDLSEFSQRYPHVHQRTYYRWKRRIKEEYIILEQCPHMSFDQFSSVVLQAKESVFNLWKSFIAQGKGFFAPSDASKRLEAKCPTSKAVNTLSDQYSFLQKNLSCTQEQFCQKFLNTSEEVFIALKRKVLQEFWVFYHNQHLDWKEFTKLVDISEEVHNSWRDHVSKDVKPTMSCFSPNAQMVSPHYPNFQNACDPQAQLLKANFPTIDSTLEDSVSRSLSASYLNSVQNMMFPWASYYGVHAPLNQQMLPMMLWPRMMGLNAGTPNPMNLPAIMASSPSSCGSKSESPHDRTTLTSQSILQPQISLPPDTKNVKTEKMKVYSQSKDADEDGLHGVKRSSSLVINENDTTNESDCHKKQRLREEVENMNAHSPVSKSRKQNKQEYIYYLKNPSLNFKDLESLFPTISLRTFYRWRKEMNAALLFIQGKKDADYQQFKLVFPDIPEDVFEIWGAKSCKENLGEKIALPENGHRHEEKFEHPARIEEVKEFPVCLKRNEMSHQMDHHSDKFNNSKDFAILGESSPAKKQFKAAHVFIHQNPNVDFASFSQKFPNISARSFYRWKKEWKDAIEILQANPGIDYERYKSIDSSVTEEIFEAWKQFLYDARTLAKDSINYSGPSVESKVNANRDEYTVRKLSSREFAYLQLHPEIEFHQFKDIFPYVANDTFCQWKKEIEKIINYVRSQPSVSFEEISAVLPDVSEDAFLRWKELIAFERQNIRSAEEVKIIHAYKSGGDIKRGDSHKENSTLQNDNEEAKTKMTNALLHLMHNPNIEYHVFSQLFPFVSTETFELWLHRIKAVILHISSNPSLDFEEFRSAITDIGEDIFEKWKALTPEQISAIGNQSFETSITEVTNNSLKDSKRVRALYFCKENPDVTYDVFSTHYFNISETDFKCWMLKISTQISFIRDNKNMTFEDFSGIYPDVEKAIFDSWKSSLSRAETLPHFLEPLPDDNSASVERSNNVSDRITNGQVDPSMSEMYGIEGSGLLKSEIGSVDNAVSQMNFSDDTSIKDQDSSLRKLAKLTESNASYYRGWNPRGVVDIPSSKDYVHTNGISDQSPNPSTDYGYDCSENNNNTDSNDFVSGYPDHYQANDSASVALQRSVMSPPLSDGLLSKVDSGVEQYDSISLNQENQSLSALMVMSADRHKFPSVSSTPKMEKNSECLPQSFPSQGKWKYDSSATSTKDEEEMFSSQRQKKMSRAEYLFVKDNPDVDSQEFARIFPGVSARTFYRWKKEIKAQMQIA